MQVFEGHFAHCSGSIFLTIDFDKVAVSSMLSMGCQRCQLHASPGGEKRDRKGRRKLQKPTWPETLRVPSSNPCVNRIMNDSCRDS